MPKPFLTDIFQNHHLVGQRRGHRRLPYILIPEEATKDGTVIRQSRLNWPQTLSKAHFTLELEKMDLEGDYGFQQDFTQEEIHGYFRQMNK